MKNKSIFVAVLFVLGVVAVWAYAADLPKWFPFQEKHALEEWQEKVFNNKVMYEVQPGTSSGYLQAKSDQACSGLIYRLRFNAREVPLMSWDWKVAEFPEGETRQDAEGGWVERDDFAARVYVIFPSWNVFNIRSLEYVWSEDLPEGTVMASPFTPKIKMFVIHSGKHDMGQWVSERRNIYEDYKQAFGNVGDLRVGAIALMTDADDSLSTAEAHYKNIRVGYSHENN